MAAIKVDSVRFNTPEFRLFIMTLMQVDGTHTCSLSLVSLR